MLVSFHFLFLFIYITFPVDKLSPPWFSYPSSEYSCTSSRNLWCHRACHCRHAAAGRASWWTGSPSRYALWPPSAACQRTPSCRRESSAHLRHRHPPGRGQTERKETVWGQSLPHMFNWGRADSNVISAVFFSCSSVCLSSQTSF